MRAENLVFTHSSPRADTIAAVVLPEEQMTTTKAVDLLSGPGGLASFLRRRQLGVRLAGPSLPLDIGYAETIPAGIRNAVMLRDRHCQWAGGCNQPAGTCEVHHTKHKKNGGKTSVKDCILLCPFHHQIVIHPVGLDPGPEPRRHHHCLEQGQDQSPAQRRTACPRRLSPRPSGCTNLCRFVGAASR